MELRFALAVGCLIAVAWAGCLQDSAATEKGSQAARQVRPDGPDAIARPYKPYVVVAVVDTGVNPYHSEFIEQYDHSDPASYIPGYPTDVVPLRLSPFKQPVSAQLPNREKADAALWESTKPNTLYRIEDTKIVGLISTFTGAASGLPGSGHGTMTSSRATGNTISTGGPDARLVMVTPFSIESIEWAAAQPWIDMISLSSGLTTGTLVPGSSHVLPDDVAIMKRLNAAAHKKPLFASSGNGIGNAGVLGFPSWLRGPSGVPDVISVGANDNGRMSVWHNQHSYIAGDGCGNPSAIDNSADKITNTGGGTSSATPFSAGSGAKLLLEARRLLGDTHVGVRSQPKPIPSFNTWKTGYDGDASIILAEGDAKAAGITEGPLADGLFTMQEFKDVVFHTAIAGGSEDKSDGILCVGPGGAYVPGSQVPGEVRVNFEGYGEVNGLSTDAAIKVLKGESKDPSRPMEDEWYARFYSLKTVSFPG